MQPSGLVVTYRDDWWCFLRKAIPCRFQGVRCSDVVVGDTKATHLPRRRAFENRVEGTITLLVSATFNPFVPLFPMIVFANT